MDTENKVTTPSGKAVYHSLLFILCVAIGFGIAFFSKHLDGISFFSKFFIAVVLTVGSYVGFFIGDLLRKIVMPDIVFSTGFFDLLKTRLFWMCGPQLIGLLIGVLISQSYLEKNGYFSKEEAVNSKSELTEAERQFAIEISNVIIPILPANFSNNNMTIYTADETSVVGLAIASGGSGQDFFFGNSFNANNGSTCEAYEPLSPQIQGELYRFTSKNCSAEVKIHDNKIIVSDSNQCGFCGLNASLEGEYQSLAEIEFDYSNGSVTIKDFKRVP